MQERSIPAADRRVRTLRREGGGATFRMRVAALGRQQDTAREGAVGPSTQRGVDRGVTPPRLAQRWAVTPEVGHAPNLR
jgi:hypothetical protein